MLTFISKKTTTANSLNIGEGSQRINSFVIENGTLAQRKEALKTDMSSFRAESESLKSNNGGSSHY